MGQHLERKAMSVDDSVGARLDREAREQRRDTEESLRIEARAQAEADAAQIQSGKILSADKPADHRPFLPKNHPEYMEESSDDEDAYLKQAYGITDDLPPPPPVEKKEAEALEVHADAATPTGRRRRSGGRGPRPGSFEGGEGGRQRRDQRGQGEQPAE